MKNNLKVNTKSYTSRFHDGQSDTIREECVTVRKSPFIIPRMLPALRAQMHEEYRQLVLQAQRYYQ